jgi:hypothetical protein
MNRQQQEDFLHQLLMGEWEKCLSERNFLAVSEWLRDRKEPEVFLKLVLWDATQGSYGIYLGCDPNKGAPMITRLFVPNDKNPDGLDTPEEIAEVPLFCIPHHPIWKIENKETSVDDKID